MIWAAVAFAWELRGADAVPTGRTVDPHTLFAPTPWPEATVVSDSRAVAAAAADALAWIDAHPAPDLFGELGIGPARDSLARIVEIAAEDALSGADRLADPAFLAAEFQLWRWTPDAAGARARGLRVDERIRLTRYFVPQVEGAAQKGGAFTAALYADPGEPHRSRHTRAEVFGGVYERDPVATPLCWLRPADAYDALLQGSIEVGGRLLNVDVHNGRPYRPGVAAEAQEALWYFREVDALYGVGGPGDKLRLQDGASVAGDVHNLGVGRVFALEYPGPTGTSLRLVVLGDTGGAFQPNLFQLDWLAGRFPDRAALYAATASVPDRVRAGLLVRR